MVRFTGSESSRSSVVARLAAILAEDTAPWRERILKRVAKEVPSFQLSGGLPESDLGAWLDKLEDGVLSRLQHGRPLDVRIFEEFGRAHAQADIPLVDVYAVLWIAFESDWWQLTEAAKGHDIAARDLVEGAEVLWSLARAASASVVDAYRTSAVRRAVERERQTSALFRALLADGFLDPDTTQQSLLALGLDGAKSFALIVARAAPDGEVSALPGIRAKLAESGQRSSWQVDLSETTGLVALDSQRSLAILLQELSRSVVGAVGVSTARAPGEIARAHRQARNAMESAGGRADVVVFGDHFAESVVAAASPAIVDPLVEATLSGLDSLGDDARRSLLETFLSWLDHRGEVSEVARLTYRHPNTVKYRLRRLETLTSRSLKNPADVVDLALAARIALSRGWNVEGAAAK
ncbi:PucR family transcriptional regulator [Arthrobacter sp. RCC_34]|uniref:PucR family transcriptional regulator n=1 Tax=Arthrobacter sp. RCC_34 TaxID=3239230 RepID=UPI0035257A38